MVSKPQKIKFVNFFLSGKGVYTLENDIVGKICMSPIQIGKNYRVQTFTHKPPFVRFQ